MLPRTLLTHNLRQRFVSRHSHPACGTGGGRWAGKGEGTACAAESRLCPFPPQCLFNVLLGCKCVQAQRNDGFFSGHAYRFPLTCCLWNLQSLFCFYELFKKQTQVSSPLGIILRTSSLSIPPWRCSGCPRKFMYVPRAVFIFISERKGEEPCTLPECIHSTTRTTRKGIQNDRFSEQLLRSPTRPAV